MNEPISNKECCELLETALSTSRYFIFREDFLNIMSRDAALVLQKLINRRDYLLSKGKIKKADEYFRCPIDQIEQSLKMSKKCQERVFGELRGVGGENGETIEENRFITTGKTNTSPPKRMVAIHNLTLVRALLNKRNLSNVPETGGLKTPKRGRLNATKRGSLNATEKGLCMLPKGDIQTLPKGDVSTIEKKEVNKNNTETDCQPEVDSESVYKNNKFPTVYFNLIKDIIKALQKAKKYIRSANEHKWAEEIHQLVTEVMVRDNLSEVQSFSYIEKIVRKYLPHLKERYFPKAYSAATIRTKFINIEEALERYHEDKKLDSRDELNLIKISPRVHHILDELNKLDWPKGSKSQLPEVCQISYDNYKMFKSKIEKLHDKVTKNEVDVKVSTVRNLIERLNDHLPSGTSFVEQWFKRENKKAEWDNWPGNLYPIKTEKRNFKNQIIEDVVKGFCSEDWFPKVLELLEQV